MDGGAPAQKVDAWKFPKVSVLRHPAQQHIAATAAGRMEDLRNKHDVACPPHRYYPNR